MSLSVLPFSLQLPSGYSLSAGNGGTQSTAASSAATGAAANPTTSETDSPTTDVISISNSFDAGTFTAVAGDIFSLSALL